MKLWQEKPILRSPDSYIPAVNTLRFLKGKHRVLLVGDAGGREWKILKDAGKEIHSVDLAPQAGIANLIVQSIETRTPFSDGYFDGVVMNEVLEHLFHDVDALTEVRRILKDDGVLVVTVPYFSNDQDSAEYHVRVHSPKTIRRLLEKCGFEIEEHFCRGFSTRFAQKNLAFRGLVYAGHKAVERLLKKSPEEAVSIVNGFLERLERFVGGHRQTAWLQRFFTSYGGILRAKKGKQKNFDDIQRAHFSNVVS